MSGPISWPSPLLRRHHILDVEGLAPKRLPVHTPGIGKGGRWRRSANVGWTSSGVPGHKFAGRMGFENADVFAVSAARTGRMSC